MSVEVALVSSVVFWLWFFALSTLLASYWRYDRIPRRARSLIVGRPPGTGPMRAVSAGVIWVLLVISQVTAGLLIIENLATLTPVEFVILLLEPILSLGWAIYLYRLLAEPE